MPPLSAPTISVPPSPVPLSSALLRAARPSAEPVGRVGHGFFDKGTTDIDRGLLLCGHCYRRLHQESWRVIAEQGEHGGFWLQPPANIDTTQTLIPLVNKSPLMLESKRQQDADVS